MINMVEIANMAQWRIREHKEFVTGVSFMMKEFAKNKIYNGDKKDFAKYLTSKIEQTTINMLIHKDNAELLNIHIGSLALFNAMLQVIMELEEK